MENSTITIPPLASTWKRMQQASGRSVNVLRSCMLFTIISSIAQGLAFACFYPLLDLIINSPSDKNSILLWCLALAFCAVVDALFCWLSHGFDYSGVLANVTHDLRIALGNQLRSMPLEELYRKKTGELSAVLAGNVDEVVTPMGMLSSTFVGIIITPVVATVATAFVDWRMALAMACVFPLAIPLYRRRRRAASVGMRSIAASHARTAAELVEYVQGLPVLRSTNQVGERATRVQSALKNLLEVQKAYQLRGVWPGILFTSLIRISLLVVLALGIALITFGSMNVAVLVALLVVVVRFSEPLSMLYGIIPVFDYMEAGLERVERLLAVKPLPVMNGPQTPERFGVSFEDVSFRYADTDEDVLRTSNFTMPERKLTALVGASGCGKTTITRLIMRYADPQNGVVRIGGVDIRSIDSKVLMRHISVVFQDVYLFDDTIAANIRMGKSTATDAEVEAAAKAAHCHEFISRLPHGYATRVGDIGGCLSGGEKQRISIARAMLKDAPIVILDEPTAALDTESEVAVQRAIDRLVCDRTVIVIAHRLSTIVGADSILVVEDGRIVEEGRHEALLAMGKRYRSMWDAQQSAKEWHLV